MTKVRDIKVRTYSERVEALLAPYRQAIGDDFEGYRNHIYRVLSFTMYFLEDDEALLPLIETVLVYHDMGLWPDRELAYLEPSSQRALADNQRLGWGLDPQLLHQCIVQHHKITPYRGPHARIVNAVRCGDWVDASMGLVRHGMPRQHVRAVQAQLPAAGFYRTLARIGPELTRWHPLKMVRGYLKILRF